MQRCCNFNPCPFGMRCRNKASHIVQDHKSVVATHKTASVTTSIPKNVSTSDVKTMIAHKTVETKVVDKPEVPPKDSLSLINEIKTMFYLRDANGGNSTESLADCIKMAQSSELARLGPFSIGKDNLPWNARPWSRLDHDTPHDVYDQSKRNSVQLLRL